jgi:DNA-binding Xre family transcriptional regulator
MYHQKGWSQRALAKEFGVSRRLIQFIVFPEKMEQNKQRREERGGWRQYYDKETRRKDMAKHRKWKKTLLEEGVLE